MTDIYYNPEAFDLETVAEIELEEPDYSFDIALVQQDTKSKKFYVNTDSGCSCPSPFEGFTTKASLGQPLGAHQAVKKIGELVSGNAHAAASAAEAIAKVMAR